MIAENAASAILRASAPTFRIVTIQMDNANAAKVRDHLRSLFRDDPRFRVESEERTNSVILQAPEEQIRRAAERIEWLDFRESGKPYLHVIALQHAPAAVTARKLQNQMGAGRVPTVVEERTNIILRHNGHPELVRQALEILEWLDRKE
jgi:type II secretory pathway component GspD/PulD (secretin)